MKLAENISGGAKRPAGHRNSWLKNARFPGRPYQNGRLDNQVPSLDKLRQLANSFGISVDELVQDDSESGKTPQTESPSLVELDQARQTRQRRHGWTAATIVCLIVAVEFLAFRL